MMLEDNSERELQLAYQKLMDHLCQENDVPSIPIKIVERIEGLDHIGGMFFQKEWRIEISKEHGDVLTLGHEFIHYLIHLTTVATDVEEHLTQWAMLGLRMDMNDKKEFTKTKLLMDEVQKRINGLQSS